MQCLLVIDPSCRLCNGRLVEMLGSIALDYRSVGSRPRRRDRNRRHL